MDFKINAIGGAVQATLVTITGYPFDLVKARIQSKKYNNSWNCIKGTYEKEGIRGFYRGSTMPWISHLVKRPIQYPLSEILKNKLEPNFYNNYIIGFGTGLIGPIFGTPLQVVKVVTQTSSHINSKEVIKNVYKENGIKGFYRGFVPTLMKDSIFGMSFIGNYYTFRDVLGSNKWWKSFISGSMAHCITWSLFIPIDYVKTNIQRSKRKITIREVIINGIKNDITIFWKGLIPACLRTIPVSGIAMTGYELVRINFLK